MDGVSSTPVISRFRNVLLISLVVTFACFGAATPPAGAIYHGYPAQLAQFPWFVRVTVPRTRSGPEELCAGALIRANVVLMAAHCFKYGARTATAYWHGQTASGTVNIPGNFAPPLTNDIAMVVLSSSLPGAPIPIEATPIPTGTWLTMIGYGCTTKPGTLKCKTSNSLNGLAVEVVAHASCGPNLASTSLCVSSGPNSAVNVGDSGGPVMLQRRGQWYLAGIVSSQAVFRSGRYVSGVTAIPGQISWINSVLASLTPQSPSPTPSPSPSPAPSPSPGPNPTSPIEPELAPVPTFYVYRVYGTCADGACGLNVRTGPGYSEYSVLEALNEGAEVDIVCQTIGETVGPSPTTHNSSVIWDRLTDGGWVSDLYVTTPNVGTWSPPIPQC